MTPEATVLLLTLIRSLDPRFGQQDADAAKLRASAWSKILEGVDEGWAAGFVQRWYSQPRDHMLTAADIRQAWWSTVKRDEAAEHAARELASLTGSRRPPAWLPAFMAALPSKAAWKEARESKGQWWNRARELRGIAASTAIPTLTDNPVTDSGRDRACGVRDCACTHLDPCRNGWMDDAEPVKRCPICLDAVLMRGELTPSQRRARVR